MSHIDHLRSASSAFQLQPLQEVSHTGDVRVSPQGAVLSNLSGSQTISVGTEITKFPWATCVIAVLPDGREDSRLLLLQPKECLCLLSHFLQKKQKLGWGTLFEGCSCSLNRSVCSPKHEITELFPVTSARDRAGASPYLLIQQHP